MTTSGSSVRSLMTSTSAVASRLGLGCVCTTPRLTGRRTPVALTTSRADAGVGPGARPDGEAGPAAATLVAPETAGEGAGAVSVKPAGGCAPRRTMTRPAAARTSTAAARALAQRTRSAMGCTGGRGANASERSRARTPSWSATSVSGGGGALVTSPTNLRSARSRPARSRHRSHPATCAAILAARRGDSSPPTQSETRRSSRAQFMGALPAAPPRPTGA